MIPPKIVATLVTFNRFLYASVGDDKNGMELTLLSVLARQDVDPWQKAADLSRLPGTQAIQALEKLLKSVPGHEAPVECSALAGRLLALLPCPGESGGRSAAPVGRVPPPERSDAANEIGLVLIYFVAMIVCGWWLSDKTLGQDFEPSVAVSSPVAAKGVPSSLPGH